MQRHTRRHQTGVPARARWQTYFLRYLYKVPRIICLSRLRNPFTALYRLEVLEVRYFTLMAAWSRVPGSQPKKKTRPGTLRGDLAAGRPAAAGN